MLSGFFPWDLPVVKISPQWFTGPEQGKSSGRIATFILWTGMFRDGISSIPGETVIPLWDSVVISSFVRTGYTTRRWGWLLGRIGYSITHHYTLCLIYRKQFYVFRCFCIIFREIGRLKLLREHFNLPVLLCCNFNNSVTVANYMVKTPLRWCRCIETSRSAYNIYIYIYVFAFVGLGSELYKMCGVYIKIKILKYIYLITHTHTRARTYTYILF